MRLDEPGEPLIVSGSVQTTTGEPLPVAVLDVWQIDANSVYSGMTTEDLQPMSIPNDSTGIPPYTVSTALPRRHHRRGPATPIGEHSATIRGFAPTKPDPR